jgi:transposase
MARKIERIDARRFYIEEIMEIPEIAKRLNVPEKTVYRWKADDKLKGADWDKEREEIRDTSFTAYKKTLKLAVDMVENMANTGVISSQSADAVQKVVKAVKSLYKEVDSLGNILLAIGEFIEFLSERDPDMVEKLQPYLADFGNSMSKKYGKKR